MSTLHTVGSGEGSGAVSVRSFRAAPEEIHTTSAYPLERPWTHGGPDHVEGGKHSVAVTVLLFCKRKRQGTFLDS